MQKAIEQPTLKVTPIKMSKVEVAQVLENNT